MKCTDKIEHIIVDKKDVGAEIEVKCPAGCTAGAVWGTGTYTTDSAICTSAIHAGIITAEEGGTVKVTVVKSLPEYQGSEKHGITTRDWPDSWGEKAYTCTR